MSGGLALPRWLVRSRRRKPRPPMWWVVMAFLSVTLLILVVNVFEQNWISVAGGVLQAVGGRIMLRHESLDPDGLPISSALYMARVMPLMIGGGALLTIGVFVG